MKMTAPPLQARAVDALQFTPSRACTMCKRPRYYCTVESTACTTFCLILHNVHRLQRMSGMGGFGGKSSLQHCPRMENLT